MKTLLEMARSAAQTSAHCNCVTEGKPLRRCPCESLTLEFASFALDVSRIVLNLPTNELLAFASAAEEVEL